MTAVSPPTTLPPPPNAYYFPETAAEHLVKMVLAKLKTHPGYLALFGSQGFYSYKREDLSDKMIPAFQLFEDSEAFNPLELKGQLKCWIIMPPGLKQVEPANSLRSIGRTTSECFQTADWLFDEVSDPTLENPSYFVPGLVDFAQTGNVAWDAVYQSSDGSDSPSIEILVDYALDYRMWSEYLEEDQGRERDPFADSIVELQRIAGTIDAYSDNQSVVDGDAPDTSIGFDSDRTQEEE